MCLQDIILKDISTPVIFFCRTSSRLTAAEQKHIANLEAQIAELQHSVQSMAGPLEQDQGLANSPDQQLTAEASAVADILTIARSPVFDTVYSRQARRSLADHLIDDLNDDDTQQQQQAQHAGQAHAVEYMTEEEEMRVASAAFDELRCILGQLSHIGIGYWKM